MAFWRAAQKLGIAGGLAIVLLSGIAFNVLLPYRNPFSARISGVVAFFLLIAGWAVLVGATARKQNWSAKGCYGFAGASLMVIGTADILILSRFTHIGVGSMIFGFFTAASPVGWTARKIAFPELKLTAQETSNLTILHLD